MRRRNSIMRNYKKKSNNEIKFFFPNELEQIFTVLNLEIAEAKKGTYKYKTAIRNRAIYKLMYFCALRVSEVCELKVKDYNMFQKEIYCTRLKGGVNNTIQLVDPSVESALKLHMRVNNPKKYLFEMISEGERKPISRKSVDAILKNVGMKTDIDKDKLHSHTFRHTMAIRLLEEGCTIYDVQYWLGHRCIENTMIYLSYTSAQQKRLYDKITSKKVRSDYARMAMI